MTKSLDSRRAALSALSGAALLLAGCDRLGTWFGSSPQFHHIDITGADYARNFVLTDHQGVQRTMDDYRGDIVVVFFGFTQCPDVCPTTMAEMARVQEALGADGARVRTLFISVDPERDTPAILAEYMGNFGPRFVGLHGSPEQTAAVAKEFRVFYSKVPGKSPGSYTIDHSAGSYVFDTQGRVRLFVRHNIDVDALAADIRQLLAAS